MPDILVIKTTIGKTVTHQRANGTYPEAGSGLDAYAASVVQGLNDLEDQKAADDPDYVEMAIGDFVQCAFCDPKLISKTKGTDHNSDISIRNGVVENAKAKRP